MVPSFSLHPQARTGDRQNAPFSLAASLIAAIAAAAFWLWPSSCSRLLAKGLAASSKSSLTTTACTGFTCDDLAQAGLRWKRGATTCGCERAKRAVPHLLHSDSPIFTAASPPTATPPNALYLLLETGHPGTLISQRSVTQNEASLTVSEIRQTLFLEETTLRRRRSNQPGH
ncbi:MAG: hypothetical protein H6668_22845 [Ardenticatenaceae bacterium]|nr:hypothetical protein [Ardenticatenaceae bacterium]